MNAWREDKIWKASGRGVGNDKLGGILPTIQEEDRAESVFDERAGDIETQGEIGGLVAQGESAISNNFGEYGDRINLSVQRGDYADEGTLGRAELCLDGGVS